MSYGVRIRRQVVPSFRMSASATPTDTPLDLTEYQQRTRPLIVFVTRYLPHFRRAVFQRLIAQESHDVDLLFLHTPDVPRGETGITAPRMEKSYHVSMRHFGRYCIQPESIRQVWRLNPDVIVCEASTHRVDILRLWLLAKAAS